MTATIFGKPLCEDCQKAHAFYEARGYEVEFKDINADPDAMALHALLDGGDTVPVIVLRGWK